MASLFLLVILVILIAGWSAKIDLYQCFVDGIKEGLGMFVPLLSSLFALLCMVSLLTSSGLLACIGRWFGSFLPMPLVCLMCLRPVSSQASLAFLDQLYAFYGTGHLFSRIGTLCQGATDTTLYVLSVYLGRHAHPKSGGFYLLCLLLDGFAMIFAIFFAFYIFL